LPTAVLVDAVRTAGGTRNGALSGWHPADLAAEVLKALVERTGVDPGRIDDVIMGCVTQIGHQSLNVGRSAVLAAGFPESVPATTVDRQGGSSEQAVHFAAQGVVAGAYDVVVAAGVEVMSSTPMGASVLPGSSPFGPAVLARYATVDSYGTSGLQSQGVGAELVAERWGLRREDLDAFAAHSQQRAAKASLAGRFHDEIVPVRARRLSTSGAGPLVARDEGIRPGATAEALALLPPAFLAAGKVTAGNAGPMADGASAALIMSEAKAAELGLTPRARFTAFALAGVDPVTALTGPIPATARVLERSGLSIGDIDHVEVDETFASVVLAWGREHRADPARVNPNGGAIALGHPIGAAGTRMMATMVHELGRTGGRYGLQTGGGGGLATATIIERLG